MKRAVVMLLCLGVMGCGPQAKPTDLERFIVQTYAAADAVTTPLPPAPSYQPLPFSPSVGSDPFVLPSTGTDAPLMKGNCWQPEALPQSDVLEGFELSALAFKGVIGVPGEYWALVETPDQTLHQVSVGRVLGNNRGRVDSISQHTLSITEHLPDGLGCWQLRHVRLALGKGNEG